MADSTIHESIAADAASDNDRIKSSSPAWWRPGKLLAVVFGWICVAEFVDVIFLHQLNFSSGLAEGVVDVFVLCVFSSPVYFLFYRPLRTHWQQELQAQEEIRHLNRKLMLAAEEERRTLALELHDHFGQMVTNLQCKAERIQQQMGVTNVAAGQTCQSLIETISQLGHDIRGFTSELRPDMLDDLGLVETLKWYVENQAQHYPQIQFEYHSVGIKQRLPADIEIALYRVCQEALNNIVKHANASQVIVTLAYSHPLSILTIRDDGDGLPLSMTKNVFESNSGFGLLGMRERLAAVGGSLELSSTPGEKTTVRALVPVKGEAESAWL